MNLGNFICGNGKIRVKKDVISTNALSSKKFQKYGTKPYDTRRHENRVLDNYRHLWYYNKHENKRKNVPVFRDENIGISGIRGAP